MKSSRGLTFIEVITALAILSILLPVVGIVFYNLFVTPPDQGARLKLNNEIELLSSFLYNDGHLTDNFSAGDRNPYYGNFSWTDYSNGSIPTYFLISYYATCPNASDTSCSNHIVRQVTLTNGSTLPTPTPTPTATPTPTPTSTPETPGTYTYCNVSGNDRWAWGKAWNASEWSAGRPTNPDNFFNTSARAFADADTSTYSLLCNADDNSWGYRDTASPLDYGVSSQLYTIKVTENRSLVTNISVVWRGYGGAFTQNTKLKIWNDNSGAWYTLRNLSDPGSKTIATYVDTITTNPSYYINASTGYVSLLASSDANGATPADTNFGLALSFNGTADAYSNKVTTSSTVPTNTFTFEAWVKAVNTHEIDAKSNSSTSGTSGQCYVFGAYHRVADGGAGLSVGTNGISVYEHGTGYMPPLAVYNGPVGTAWNHIAVVYSSKQPKIYLNGNLVETGLTSPKTTVYAPFEIGNGSYGAFQGYIDEVRVWNVARTQTQIRDNMYREIPNPTAEANLTGYWQFSNNVSDISGHGNNGTLSTPPPQYTASLDRDLTVYTDYIGLTVNTPAPVPTPTPTVPPPTPVTTQVAFTTVGTTTWTAPAGVTSLDNVLVVAGGGAGGGASTLYYCGAGGGAGGLRYQTNYAIPDTYVVTYTSSGSWTVPGDVTSVQVLVVGGGGGGGSTSHQYGSGGGGGAGGLQYNPSFSVTPNASISVTVGNGGNGASRSSSANGSSGGDSGFGSLTASGGGGGGGAALNGPSGGSGGGGGVRTATQGLGGSGTAGQGKNGGNSFRDGTASHNAAGGGGGNTSAGSNAVSTVGGNGGAGTDYSGIFGAVGGASGWFSGGGGGGAYGTNGNGGSGGGANGGNGDDAGGAGASAAANTGGGGGGGGGGDGDWFADYSAAGGNGGSGIVIIKYTTRILTVTVGNGGTASTGRGGNGGPSVFGSITATGGGGGGRGVTGGDADGVAGGSGGGGGQATCASGAGASGTSGQGKNGGNGVYNCWFCSNAGGGGGGNTSNGAAGGSSDGGNGGSGTDYSAIFGAVGGDTGKFAGGGGGAGCDTSGNGGLGGGGAGAPSLNGVAGLANTGGGGGGAYSGGSGQTGGAGGSGIVIIKYSINSKTLNTSAGTGGTVTTPPPPGANYVTGTVVTITAIPAQCYTFANWSGDTGTIANVNANSTTITMNNNYTIRANFAPSASTYYLNLSASPAAGGSPSYSGSSPFACSFVVPISANPNTGYNFSGWTPTDGVANASLADTTVLMTADRNLVAHYGELPAPTSIPTPESSLTSMYLTWHITTNNFSLYDRGTFIEANMSAGITTSMGKYVQKQLTIYITPRPSYLLPVEDIWGYDTISTLSSFRISGDYNAISGNVKINGTVTVDAAAEDNAIDGTLTCPTIVGDNQAKLSYTSRITGIPGNTMPRLSLTDYISTNLSTGTTDWAKADEIREYVFTGDVNLHTDAIARNHVWQGGTNPDTTHALKTGTYYSPGTITLEDTYTTGTVTFIANRIVIRNNANTGLIQGKITLGAYRDDLLFWANGSAGTPTGGFNGDILIWDTNPVGGWSNHACVSLEGVLYAPNGEIELAGSGRTGWFGYTDAAELYRGALVGKDLTISGSHWNFYRW